MSKNQSLEETGQRYDQKFVCSDNLEQNIWSKVKLSSIIRKELKTLVSIFADFLTPIDNVSFLEGRLGTRLCFHPNFTFFQCLLIS